MLINKLAKKAQTYLEKLCVEIPNRSVGSAGNWAATAFFDEVVQSFGFTTRLHTFNCMDWYEDGVRLTVGEMPFAVATSPYSNGCGVQAPLKVITTLEELAAANLAKTVVLLHGEIARQQLMPKNFPFYNPDEHKRIIQILEDKHPRAIIAATSRDPHMVGSLYPFPLIEDGDFDIPSVYMTDEEGKRLASYAGQVVTLESYAMRIPSTGYNVIASKGSSDLCRVVYFAHIDAKMGTPGAIDNASGVTTLLLLSELFASYSGTLGIEIVALNGEDYYSNPGEQQYLALNKERFKQMLLGVNLDGVGYKHGRTAYSLYDCPENISGLAHQIFAKQDTFIEGEQWYQGDHVLFLMNKRPALALTSENAMELLSNIIHTAADQPAIVDTKKLAEVALALHELHLRLDAL